MKNKENLINTVKVKLDTRDLDATTEKVKQLKDLLLEVNEVVNSLNDSRLFKYSNKKVSEDISQGEICKVCGLKHKKRWANRLSEDEARKDYLMNGVFGKGKYKELIGELSETIKKYNLDTMPETFKDVIDEIKYITLHKF